MLLVSYHSQFKSDEVEFIYDTFSSNVRLIVSIVGIAAQHICLDKILSFGRETVVTSPGSRPRRWYMEAVPCAHYMPPSRNDKIQMNAFEDGLSVEVAGKLTVLTAKNLCVSIP